ncbi:Iron-sulfur cluster biosynthesis [compost metagenome]
MNIVMSADAARWYKRELNLNQGDSVRFFPRYSSGGGLHPGFSLGISVENPTHSTLFQDVEGIHFYLEEQDLWYLKGYDLVINYVEGLDDIEYVYEEIQQ